MNELYHYGVLGQKWGIRRFQNKDGTLTRLGREHNKEQDAPFSKKTKEYSMEADAKAVNPNFYNRPHDRGYSMNCVLCTLAYDLRRRGYDVEAQPIPKLRLALGVNLTNNEYGSIYPNAPELSYVSKDTAFAEMESEPDGARGLFAFDWAGYKSGHAIAYEKKDGKLTLLDAQDGYPWSKEDLYPMIKDEGCVHERLDNRTINMSSAALRKVVKSK